MKRLSQILDLVRVDHLNKDIHSLSFQYTNPRVVLQALQHGPVNVILQCGISVNLCEPGVLQGVGTGVTETVVFIEEVGDQVFG